MIVIDAERLAASRPNRPLFADVSLTVAPGDVVELDENPDPRWFSEKPVGESGPEVLTPKKDGVVIPAPTPVDPDPKDA